MRHRRARCASHSVRFSSKAARLSRAATTTTGRTTTVPKCARAGTASPYRCTRRCMPYSASPACRRPSASSRERAPALLRSYKHRVPKNPCLHHHPHNDGCLKARRPSLHARGTRVAFHPHGPSPSPPAKRKSAEARGGGGSRSGDAGRNGSGGAGGEKRSASCRSHAASPAPPGEADKAWSARRRDPRINGADIYVARVTKVGMGSAKPCWRCVEWCRWAEVKRISTGTGRTESLTWSRLTRLSGPIRDAHRLRLYARMVSSLVRVHSLILTRYPPFRVGSSTDLGDAACLATGH